MHQQLLLNPLPDNKILDDIFIFDENSRKFSKRVENTVSKGEIARYEQFLLFLQCFQKACFLEASKGVIVWELVKEILAQIMRPQAAKILAELREVTELDGISWCINI